jgi:hypothetical protein
MLFDISTINKSTYVIDGACQELDRLDVRGGDLDKLSGLATRFVAKPAGS